MTTKHGILSGAGIVMGPTIHVERIAAPGPHRLETLFTFALEYGLTHLWITPQWDASPYAEFRTEINAFATFTYTNYDVEKIDKTVWNVLGNADQDTGKLLAVSAWRNEGTRNERRQVNICFQSRAAWSWSEELDPVVVLGTISYLERALGVAIGTSASAAGMRLIKDLNKDHPDWITDIPAGNLRDCHFTRESGRDLVWSRLLTDGEKKKKYLHLYDKNSAYLRACQEERFGVGPITHQWCDAADPHTPGTYRVVARSSAVSDRAMMTHMFGYEGEKMPPLLWGTVQKEGTWIAWPVLVMLKKIAPGTCDVQEAYVFTRHQRTLKPFAETVWGARLSLADTLKWKSLTCRAYALDGIKELATQTVGLAGSKKLDAEDWRARPDFKLGAVAGNYAIMQHNIRAFFKAHGLVPIAAYNDALLYATDEEQPYFDNRASLGGFKCSWIQPLTDQAVDIIQAKGTIPLAKRMGMLHALQEGRN